MADDSFRIAELLLQGFKCSHILMQLALEAQGRASPELVRAMSGLAVGMSQGFNCGALTGGCCVLGLYAGRGAEDEAEDPRLDVLVDEFSWWFRNHAREQFGGIDCAEIMRFDPALRQQRCPGLILRSWEKLVETLEQHGIDIAVPPQPAEPA
ncbi:C_GCAxxG_C_C family protein [Rhodovastum atsumiense]|nr:DV_1555 family C-GCAxxG-C-C protein [Rhodovastum atsumiense]CAH2603841.1 C_GCAxxG_C_C family protein [Rhodovastum atsumiense]